MAKCPCGLLAGEAGGHDITCLAYKTTTKITLEEAMQIVFACIAELKERIEALESKLESD